MEVAGRQVTRAPLACFRDPLRIIGARLRCRFFDPTDCKTHALCVGLLGKIMEKKVDVLVVGMGSYPFGKERRAVNALCRMPQVRPFFLLSKWGDESVPDMLKQHHLEFAKTSFGYLGIKRLDWTAINLFHAPRLMLTVVRTFSQRSSSVVLVLGFREFLNALPAFLYLRLWKDARFVFYLGDIPANTFVYRNLSHLAGRLCPTIIVNSKAVKRGLLAQGLLEEQITVIYNGVDLERFQNAKPHDVRAARNWSSEDVLIGYIGQFLSNKGVLDFVEAAHLVLRKNDRCRFVMTGPLDHANGCLDDLQEYIRRHGLDEYFAFTGRVEKIERVYATLDVVVVPSRHEDPAPNVNLEAMASGVPVIGTRMGGTPELLADGETGFLIEAGNPREIAARILQLAGDAELRKAIGCAGIDRVKEKFDIRENAKFVEAFLLGRG